MPSDEITEVSNGWSLRFNPLLIGRCLQTPAHDAGLVGKHMFQPPTNREMPSDRYTPFGAGDTYQQFQPPTNREMPSDPQTIHKLSTVNNEFQPPTNREMPSDLVLRFF